jgi:hypothetical protein
MNLKQLKCPQRLAYHEIGHASHLEGSSIGYWKDLIRATVAAGGHGDEDSFMAGHLQIAESWAEHMALTMVKQQYPVVAVNDPDLNTSYFRDWAERHERTRNESFGHIPIGLYNDLIDGINLSERVREEDVPEGATSAPFFDLTDPVNGGYTNSFFAQQLDAMVESPAQFRNRCLANLPPGVTINNVNTLFEEY